jgi:ABC-2 type transport system permease protein
MTAPAAGPSPAPGPFPTAAPAGGHRPGPGRRAFTAQAMNELRLSLRQGEQLLVAIGIPLVVLLFFSTVDVLPTGTDEPVDGLTPAVLGLAIMSTAMVSLGIATGFERHYGVLKRLGATPLGRPRLLAAKMAAVGVTEVAQLTVLALVGWGLGWRPGFEPLPFLAAVVLGTAAFAGVGLALAGTLSGPANLAACNGLYLLLLLFGGVAVPAAELPDGMRSVARYLPSGALVEVLGGTAGRLDAAPAAVWLALVAWAVALPALAAATFSWQPRA